MYKVLDVGHEADAAEIKRAYRKKTLAYHPDKNPGKKEIIYLLGDEEAASKFAEIARAYEILSDTTKR